MGVISVSYERFRIFFIRVTPVTAHLSKILYKSSMISEATDMQISVGKLLVLLFVLAGVTAVASVMGSPEFEHIRVATPSWY